MDTNYYPNGIVAMETDQISCGWRAAYVSCNDVYGDVGCMWYASGYEGTANHGKNRLMVSYDNGENFSQLATQNCNDTTDKCGGIASTTTDEDACGTHPDIDIVYKSILIDDTDPGTIIDEHVTYVSCGLAGDYEPTATISCVENDTEVNCSYAGYGYDGTADMGEVRFEVSIDGGEYSVIESQACGAGGWCGAGTPSSLACSGQDFGTPITYRTRVVDMDEPETVLATATKEIMCNQPNITSGPYYPVNTDTAEFEFTTYGGDTIQCRIDGGGWNSCTSPKQYTNLVPGAHTFEVKATMTSPSAFAINAMSWFVDLDDPTVAFTSPEDEAEVSTSRVMVFGTVDDGSGAGGMSVMVNESYCVVHGDATWRCDVPLEVGINYLTATVTDAAGNMDTAYLSVTRN